MMSRKPRYDDFPALIRAWPSIGAIATDLGIHRQTVFMWRTRRNIPGQYWLDVIASAEKRGIPGVTLEVMATLARDLYATAA